MTSKLSSIVRRSPGKYRVELEGLDTSQRMAFDFDVDSRDDIEVVEWSDEFARYLSQNLGRASSLMEAVLKFHRAQKVEYP